MNKMQYANIDRCYHEAGHAVVGILCGIKVNSVDMTKKGDDGGKVVFSSMRELEPSVMSMVSLAGYTAQAIFRDAPFEFCWRKGEGFKFIDLPDVVCAIDAYRGSPIWPQLVRTTQKCSARLLVRNWKSVEELAVTLMKKRRLGGKAATKIVVENLRDKIIDGEIRDPR